jgi:hypothetical protein
MYEFIIPFLPAVVSSVLPNHMHMMTTMGGSSYDDKAFPYVKTGLHETNILSHGRLMLQFNNYMFN